MIILALLGGYFLLGIVVSAWIHFYSEASAKSDDTLCLILFFPGILVWPLLLGAYIYEKAK